LADCPQLIDLTLNGSTFFIVAAFIPMPVPLLFLRCLRVLCLPDQSKFWGSLTAGVLWNIHTPALEELHLSGWHSNRAHITDFFNRLPPSKVLKSLTFANSSGVNVCGGCDDYPEHIRPQALQSFPALESLTLINICDVDTLLGELLVTSTDSAGVQCCALSSLHTLTLRYKDSDEFGIDAWPKLQSVPPDPADMVTSRLDDLRTSVARLREIRPIHLRLPCSRFFTGQDDWNPDDPNFEIFDVELLLQYCEDTEDTIHWD
jgi:hypothetical protein